ncbi:hypothetical protein ACFQ5J_09050 [Lacticaseibacillus baoqingensis]|uniref:Uncharacterized protein n=1 Tax=Lacticaseibacillus baoqingensis TaxID=2486013 RepID=A0ABW4E646_9LACO|nr:hypothetical protein [Lacticaseibacillus baoqingensis]
MIHETKWDVFNKLLAAYLKDEERLDKLVNEPDEHIPELDFMYFNKRYNAALPDEIAMIPEAVGDAIKIHKEYAHSLLDIFGTLSIYVVSRTEPALDYNA